MQTFLSDGNACKVGASVDAEGNWSTASVMTSQRPQSYWNNCFFKIINSKGYDLYKCSNKSWTLTEVPRMKPCCLIWSKLHLPASHWGLGMGFHLCLGNLSWNLSLPSIQTEHPLFSVITQPLESQLWYTCLFFFHRRNLQESVWWVQRHFLRIAFYTSWHSRTKWKIININDTQ